MVRKPVVYLLRSRQDGSCYVGWTTDLLRRLVEHNENLATSAGRKVPWQLVGFEICSDAEAAEKREQTLKHNPRMLQLFKKRMLNQAAISRSRQVVG